MFDSFVHFYDWLFFIDTMTNLFVLSLFVWFVIPERFYR
jgi:hypothetical protein